MTAREVILDFIGGGEGKYSAFESRLRQAGYAIVPVEPSERMVEAGAEVLFGSDDDTQFGEMAEKSFAAMLTAAKEGE